MKRTSSLPVFAMVAVLAVVLALIVGSLGTATASGLTKGAVKKIAAKVVKKQGPKLTVASASNANNANALAGQPRAAYLDNATVYSTTITSPISETSITIPLGPGTYHLSYSAYLSGAGVSAGSCFFSQFQGTTEFLNTGDDWGSTGLSGSAVVTVTPGQVVKLYCSADANFKTFDSNGVTDPIQIVAVPLDSVTQATLPAAPGRASGRG